MPVESLLTMAETAGGTTEGTTAGMGDFSSMLIILAIMAAFFYFMIYRPQKKREKADRQLRTSLRKGDEVVTIGGFVGTVMSVKDDEIVIETGASKTKLTIKKWAIQSRMSPVQEGEDDEDDYEDDAEEEKK